MSFTSPFPDVPLRVRPDTCIKCHTVFKTGQRVMQVWVVTGVGRHPKRQGMVPFLLDTPEFAHACCEDLSLLRADLPTIEIPRQHLKPDVVSLRPRTNEYTCTLCRKKVERGDRVLTVMIVEGIGIDPETSFPAARVTGEYEVVHVNCRDPKLDVGPGPLVVGAVT